MIGGPLIVDRWPFVFERIAMKPRMWVVPLCALLMFPLTTWGQSAGVKIAIASPPRILSQLQETKDVMNSMNSEREHLASLEKQKRDNVKSLQDARDQLKPGTSQYRERNEAFLKAAIEFDSWGKLTQVDVQRQQKEQMERMFKKIEAAVAEVAKQRGIDLVITQQKPDIPDNLDQINVQQLKDDINGQNLLYFNPKLDISDDVVALMDKQYKEAAK
jgi:Skp family chaperone for outer membrane proteins